MHDNYNERRHRFLLSNTETHYFGSNWREFRQNVDKRYNNFDIESYISSLTHDWNCLALVRMALIGYHCVSSW